VTQEEECSIIESQAGPSVANIMMMANLEISVNFLTRIILAEGIERFRQIQLMDSTTIASSNISITTKTAITRTKNLVSLRMKECNAKNRSILRQETKVHVLAILTRTIINQMLKIKYL
jgi:hypothetical protein